ncbi:unnamed protein product, partial [Oppiella nova]
MMSIENNSIVGNSSATKPLLSSISRAMLDTSHAMTDPNQTNGSNSYSDNDLSEWIGHRVLAKTERGLYEKGVIDDCDRLKGIGVLFDRTNGVQYYESVSTDLVADCCPLAAQITVGMDVIAKC